ncbi:N-acetylmuramic acid 6-phosphate etherase [Clostridium botulinum]|uniref:N-acetylmuramic acid 6-phosphate etherase n=1 Tax=Clostridium botulinum (strain Eklund 17B / Type B) TaxID=935198 RepID=MURQ_CLOBB|nr:RecName: Full=N-acetylmuramic acid 6-phosphate etherase; Short=MurNAc-6-P etherase; AltName: Full=N-acetylmuramic acid 6-phosphate hydrolase; AltName: Full=N-acetylmuramic acid 6-phosphate lyase [Clostridium botulinum B str. Eklund 17B (NRP)]MBY6975428.1 N-acetylmuramic acid 6-phosphate etherase [Clostridium botulinum]ACD24255.1 N-acetylmuramic acid 6-phosphate etherase [Clostridium botulinum B str. Eklund 17B (NRP)]MBY7000977.1 N-acetylmuramic acid 6-phosphate etherase [Clostridium botulinum
MGSIIDNLETEKRNINSENIDIMSTCEIIKTINSEDKKIAYAIEKVIPEIEKLIDATYEKMLFGGRVIYIGAGTSGRLGVLDASECPPTYGVDASLVQGIIAGGYGALLKAKEGAEDSLTLAKEDLKEIKLNSHDTVIGLAASGRTPYVIGGLDYANEIGALTGAISCVNNAQISQHAKYFIEAIVGAEVITGSTRMKAGTAQKMILNMISTSLMIKKGKVYHNLMVDVQPTNKKLIERSKNIIAECTNSSVEEAEKALIDSGNQVKVAMLMLLTKKDKKSCINILNENDGNISKSIRNIP